MRKILLVFAALVALAAGAFFLGARHNASRTEQLYREALAGIREQAPQFTAENVEYTRGLLGATALTRITLPLPEGGAEGKPKELAFVLRHDIAHGPLLMRRLPGAPSGLAQGVMVTTVAEWPAEYREALSKVQPRNVTVVALSGELTSQTTVPAFAQEFTPDAGQPGRKAALGFRALDVVITAAAGLQNGTGKGAWGGLEISGDDGRVNVAGMDLDWTFRKAPSGLYTGVSTMVFRRVEGDLKAAGGSGGAFSMEPLEMRATLDEQAGKLLYALAAKGGKVAVKDGDAYGPFALDMEVRNLDAAALVRMRKELAGMNVAKPGQAPEAAAQEALGRLSALLPEVVRHGPELEVKQLSAETPQGRVQGGLSIRLPPKAPPMALLSPEALEYFKGVFAQGKVDLPEGLVMAVTTETMKGQLAQMGLEDDELEEAAQQAADDSLNQLLESGVVKREGERLASSFSLQGGKLAVNGQEVPLLPTE